MDLWLWLVMVAVVISVVGDQIREEIEVAVLPGDLFILLFLGWGGAGGGAGCGSGMGMFESIRLIFKCKF